MNYQSVLFTLILLFGSATIGQAATYQFSFSNVDGPVSGTVNGVLELPDGDGDFAATSLIIDSAPLELGYETPFDVLGEFTLVLANSFSVVNSVIVDAEFGAQRPGFEGGALALSYTSFGTLLSVERSINPDSGVADYGNTTLSLGDPAVVPAPASGLLLIAGLAMLGFRRLSRA